MGKEVALAVVAGVGLAAGGWVVGKYQERGKTEAKVATARVEEAAKWQTKVDDLKAKISLKADSQDYYDFLVALVAVGNTFAGGNKPLALEHQQLILTFVAGGSSGKLPLSVLTRLHDIGSAPPSVRTAWELAKRFHPKQAGVFEDLMSVLEAEGLGAQAQAFRMKWAIFNRVA